MRIAGTWSVCLRAALFTTVLGVAALAAPAFAFAGGSTAAAAGAHIVRAVKQESGQPHGMTLRGSRPALNLGSWPGSSGPIAANQYYGYPYPNAPECTNGGACVADQWRFYQGQCTSWVAYRLNQLNGIAFSDYYGGKQWGDAVNWASTASGLGIAVNDAPAVGAVAWYAADHVAYVEQVNSPTSIVISEMNYDYANGFRVRTVTAGQSGWPTHFIHIADRSSSGGPLPDGTFVQVAGTAPIYRIAGGAPLYVSNWAAVGGSQPYTVISQAQFDGLNAYPANGTFLRDEAGTIWVVAGGDPLWVNSCADLNGCGGLIQIDGADVANAGMGPPWNHLTTAIADGTFVRVADGAKTGWISRVAGGALLHLSSCAPAELASCDSTVNINEYAYDTYAADHPAIANGAYVRVADGSEYGWIGRAVGGALIHLTSCAPAALAGCASAVNVNQYSYTAYSNAHPHPVNGSVIEKVPSATFWLFKNGICITGKPSASAVAINDNSISCAGTPSVRTTALPNGQVKTAYSHTLTASGGASPYTWKLASGTLPPGLQLSSRGLLSGRPAKAGTWRFTVKITDKASQTATRKLSLVIKN